MSSKTPIAAVAVLACAWAAQAAAERGFTNEFANGTTRPQSIALLPVDATIVRARVAQTEGLVDESVRYGELLNEEVEQALEAKGYHVQIVDAERLGADARLQEYVVDATRAYDDMMKQYRPKRLEKRIYTAGDPAKLLASYLGVDALAFSRLSLTITPAGKAIVSALIGGASSGAGGSLGVVNGKTGELEAVLFGVAIVTPGEKTDAELEGYVATVAAHTTKRMPGADPSSRVDVALDEDDVLEEAEQLLKE